MDQHGERHQYHRNIIPCTSGIGIEESLLMALMPFSPIVALSSLLCSLGSWSSLVTSSWIEAGMLVK
jgi:hypothetical protein